MGDRWDHIPADAFMEILRRVPSSPRRRLRLVCRHWRSVIDDRTPATQAQPMVLAFVVGHDVPCAYVLDDLTTEHGTSGRELKLPRAALDWGVSMVGTCNGLLCLRRRWEDDFIVVNPVTGEKLAVPPPPEPHGGSQKADAYGFAYHPATGLYKIVHVPWIGEVNVFALGDGAWREVTLPVPIWLRRVPSFGLTNVGGAMYWVATDPHFQSHSVMSLDVKDERVVFVATLPVRIGLTHLSWHLTTDLRGRLVFALCFRETKQGRMLKGIHAKVWILDDGETSKNPPEWVLLCTVVDSGQELPQGIALPHVIHGEHILTTQARAGYEYDRRVSLHACHLSEARTLDGVVRMEGSPSIGMYDACRSLQTFAYVETMEPLALYRGNGCGIGDSEEWDWRFDGGERRWKLMSCSSSSLL
ncbi:hypothetical protein HU200_065718 [Digitaria exilis]|uniref:F-box domain-containing protein n=1 Tax=Digitaria exilis TaxID=1010633 RepID=A0A835DUF7_9POAL|nr:hypothetical protein HU200_065718 [Digitaria exilis]